MTYTHAKFNWSISNIIEHNGSKLWQASESYLHLFQKSYKVIYLNSHYGLLKETENKLHWFNVVLKIISYATVVLPLIAVCIREIYRNHYQFEIIDDSTKSNKPIKKKKEKIDHFPQITADKSVKENIALFKSALEQKWDQLEQNILIKLRIKTDDRKINLDQLPDLLKSKESYLASQEAVVEAVFNSLHALIQKPVNPQNLKDSIGVYKLVSAFLRQNSPESYIPKYKKYLSNILQNGFFQEDDDITPGGYLPEENRRQMETHAALFFLMKNLRKRIKLAAKFEKIKVKFNADLNVKKIDPDIAQQAFKYLGLTWMHGTKANIIKSACEHSERQLLPLGELRKRKIQTLTGAIDLGGTAIGINERFISGVNLHAASRAIDGYARKFSFNVDGELEKYEYIFKKKYYNFSHFTSCEDDFNRSIDAICRIKKCKPEVFEKDRERIQAKIKEIHEGIETEIFKKRPKEIFGWHDECFTSCFYSILKSLENLENLLAEPLEKESLDKENEELATIPLVVASDSVHGILTCPSSIMEDTEEEYLGPLTFGKDINYLFANTKDVPKVKELVKRYGMADSVTVEPMEILEAAQKIDWALGSYFYDVYNIKKWEKA